MKRRVLACFLVPPCLVVLAALLGGCVPPTQPPTGGGDFTATTLVWTKDTEGFDQFSTNDPGNCSSSFMAWHDPFCDPTGTLEVQVKKMSGNKWAAFGLVFCLQDLQNFYALVIDTQGDYAIFKRWYGSWYTLVDWTYLDLLKTGYGVANDLRIDHVGSSFTFSFNGAAAGNFVDSSMSKGYWGPLVDVLSGDYEDFPSQPVDVRLKLTAVSAVLVQAAAGMETTEEGGASTFTVVLGSRPSSDVTIGLTCSDLSEAAVAPASLTFTTANWETPQVVTVTGVDDLVADGDKVYSVATSAASSLDPRYNGFDAPDVQLRSKDNEIYKIVSPSTREGSSLGLAAAAGGDRVIVGGYDARAGVGAAFVYKRLGTNVWSPAVRIVSPDGAPTFGCSVAISGDYAAIGARGDGDSGSGAGAVYVAHRGAGDSWDVGVKLHAADGQASDGFGQSAAISGDYLIAGAPGEDQLGTDAGAAYIFHRTGPNSWDEGTKITPPDGQAYDGFGGSVAIDGDYAIVGAEGEDGASANSAGAAYVYQRTGTNTWSAGTKLTAPSPQASDCFGGSVAISGPYAIVGAREANRPGSAYVFYRADTDWDVGTRIVAPDGQAGDAFGWCVDIDADWAIVSAVFKHDLGLDAGAAYLYHRTGTASWDAGSRVASPDTRQDDRFGGSVGICGGSAVIVARGQDDGGNNLGAAYVIRY